MKTHNVSYYITLNIKIQWKKMHVEFLSMMYLSIQILPRKVLFIKHDSKKTA